MRTCGRMRTANNAEQRAARRAWGEDALLVWRGMRLPLPQYVRIFVICPGGIDGFRANWVSGDCRSTVGSRTLRRLASRCVDGWPTWATWAA